ncbi:MAG: hypothetical protein AD742_14665 [Methylibium sp. NZG]|nr:MAG: hypothetical protein AD742_14665 [Methylibium sp. NZG]
MVTTSRARRCAGTAAVWLVLLFAGAAPLAAHAQDAAALKARHAALREVLASNPFTRPVHLVSVENATDLRGHVYAVVEQPFAAVSQALRPIAHWCDILILHLNVKQCRAERPDALRLHIGRKSDQPLAEAYRFDFAYRVVTAQPDYFQLALDAEDGPMGTSHYRIALEVVALDAGRSFIHLSYAYAYGMTARLAMQTYLATLGRDKVGFSVVGTHPDGRPRHVGGTRGVIERNTMRYYLAIESYLGALSAPPAQQLDKRLDAWHAGVERYPLQLRDLERAEYLDMKRREVERQREPQG